MRGAAPAIVVFTATLLIGGCHDEPRDPVARLARTQTEVRLEATDGLPTFLIEAYFDAAIDSKPHVRPVTAAIVAARGKCFTRSGPPPETFSVLDVAVRDRKVTVTQPVGCLANAMNASAIDDPGTFAVSIVVRVGA